jgi:hypothetical protein
MWKRWEEEAREAKRKAAAAIERAIPAVLQALAEQAAGGDRRARRLLEEVLHNAKGDGVGEKTRTQ